MRLFFLIATVLAAVQLPMVAAETAEEQQIAILQSNASLQQKDAACAELKRVGTARCVPVLAPLLADEQLTHSARYALESMSQPEAGAALIGALNKTTGLAKAGIINSLGNRHETAALTALTPLVRDRDPLVASAAAVALGKIGGIQALQVLNAARADAPREVQPAVIDGLLRCAEQSLAKGDNTAASVIYRQCLDSKEPRFQTAAQRGLILSAGRDAASLALKALSSDDRSARLAALQLIAVIPGSTATKAFAKSLPSFAPDLQVAVIDALKQRGDAAAIPALVSASRTSAEAVCISALQAIGTLGDGSVIPSLAETAATTKGAVQEAAREALNRIHGKNITQAMLAHLPKATSEARAELLLAMGRRRDAAAVPTLLKIAASSDQLCRTASLQSLALTADESVVSNLVKLLAKAGTDAERDAVEQTLLTICSRSKRSQTCATPVLTAMKDAPPPVRCALLRILGRIAGPEALQELRAATSNKDSAIQDAAIRSLADAGRVDAMSDLLALAKDAPALPHRVLALRGYWRAVSLASEYPPADRLKMCAAGFAASQRPEEKKLGLIELVKIPDEGAIKLAESLLSDSGVRAEAALAVVQIARDMYGAHRATAKAALNRLLANSSDVAACQAAGALLSELEPGIGFLIAWQVAGPYAQAGKNHRALFDIPFPPEQPGTQPLNWRTLPSNTTPGKPTQLDLLKFLGGEQCVAYVRTCIHSSKQQPARLDLGTDDGVKVWLNGTQVHANNVARPIKPGSDKVAITLKEGWNTLLMKITQNTMGWEFCARIVKPDGTPLVGLRNEISPTP